MRRRASARLSAKELDRLLEADEHFTAAFKLAEPFLEEDHFEAARGLANDIAIPSSGHNGVIFYANVLVPIPPDPCQFWQDFALSRQGPVRARG